MRYAQRKLASIADAVGRTPLLKLRSIGRDVPGAEIYLKLEFLNPGGSVKDRPALQMIREALEAGRLEMNRGGPTLIDATSGNTGVAYGMLGASLGIPVTLVMPENVTLARKKITAAYGAEIVHSSPMEGSDGAIRMVREMVGAEPSRYFYIDQYANQGNPRAHYLGTAVEILEDVGDRLTHFVSGLGTSGTVMGTGRRLKEHRKDIQVIGVEPGEPLHGLEGLKHMESSIVPAIFRREALDETLFVKTEEGWDMAERLMREEGLFVGHSTGANVFAALHVARRVRHGCIVTIACDRGDRYFQPRKWERKYEW